MPASTHYRRPPFQLPVVEMLGPSLRALGVLAGLTLAVAAHAQAGSGGLSAAEFLSRVRSSNPSLAVLQAKVEQAQAAVDSARIWPNPSLGYDREELSARGVENTENFLRFQLPLEFSGRRERRARGAERAVEAVRASSEFDRATLLVEAMHLYWKASAARQTLELLRQEHSALEGHLRVLRARPAPGGVPGYDHDRIELEADWLSDLIADAQRELHTYGLGLGLVTGAAGSRLDASDELLAPASPGPLDELVQTGQNQRPDLLSERHRIAQAEHELSAGERGWIPSIVLTGGVKTGLVQSETHLGYVAGLSVDIPVFDHGQAESAQARADLSRAKAQLGRLEQQATAEINAARDVLLKTLEQIERFETNQLPRVKKLVRRAEIAFGDGARPSLEMLDAYRSARGLRLRHIELLLRARHAELELLLATGQSPGQAK